MTGTDAKPDLSTATTAEIVAYVARRPRLWPGFARVVVQHVIAKAGFYLACWSHGYTVREVRRIAREWWQ